MKMWTFIFVLLSAAGGAWAQTDCLSCHTDKNTAKASVHGGLSCSGCHADIKGFPHPDKIAKVDCSGCHASAGPDVAASVHAKVSQQACLGCHGDAHAILPATNPQSAVYPANLPKTCGTCHQNAELAKQYGITEVYSEYMDSIHGFALTKEGLLVAASCSSCHGSHKILSSKDSASRTNRANVPATCGACHAGALQAFSSGIHGQMVQAGAAEAPVCTSCHTAHEIAKVSAAGWQMKTTATCGGCHKDQLATYHDTFHAQVSALGYQQTARCWDCHGEHDILPASDPKSTVAPANLQATCSKCHPGANASFVKYDPHADAHDSAHYPALHASAVFMNLLLASVLGFFALHTILWFLRSRSGGGVGSKEG
jgi:predicted CXXCH cytochrome family protein